MKYVPLPPVPTVLVAKPGLTSCQRKTIVRSSNPNNIMTKPWIFSLKLILFCSLKISVSQEEKERKENSFRHFFNLFMALATWKMVAWKRHFVGSVPLILWFRKNDFRNWVHFFPENSVHLWFYDFWLIGNILLWFSSRAATISWMHITIDKFLIN